MNNWSPIFDIKSESDFEEWCLKTFDFQVKNNPVYREFCDYLGKTEVKAITDIPFLPISLFKTHKVHCSKVDPELVFMSSGTTNSNRSKHFVDYPELYRQSFLKQYEQVFGSAKDQVILALLPSYLEQGNSSLVYMVDALIKESGNELSSFVLQDSKSLVQKYETALRDGKKVIVFGVSYALIDLAESEPNLSEAIIIETGGMKGRRAEWTKEELHNFIYQKMHSPQIFSEYGMTELLSQGYAIKDGYFEFPNWMKVVLRETNDPLSFHTGHKSGGINIIDLANFYSCSFIATDDLGRIENGGLKLLGRIDHSDIRGCNLMVE
jgi:hypothetical protein